MKKILIIAVLILSGLLGFLLSLYLHQNVERVDEAQRMQTFHYPTFFVKQLAGDPQAGKKIFKEYCASCHGAQPVIDIKAPRINDTKAWKERRKLGVPALLNKTIEGLGAMPARGGCFECSDEQLRETIQYILSPTTSSSNQRKYHSSQPNPP